MSRSQFSWIKNSSSVYMKQHYKLLNALLVYKPTAELQTRAKYSKRKITIVPHCNLIGRRFIFAFLWHMNLVIKARLCYKKKYAVSIVFGATTHTHYSRSIRIQRSYIYVHFSDFQLFILIRASESTCECR